MSETADVQESLHRLMDFWSVCDPKDDQLEIQLYILFCNIVKKGANPWEEREEDWGNPYGSSYDERSPFSRILEIFSKYVKASLSRKYLIKSPLDAPYQHLERLIKELLLYYERENKKDPLPLEKIVQEVLYTFSVEYIQYAIDSVKDICKIDITPEGYNCFSLVDEDPQSFFIPTYEIYLLNKKKEEEEEWAERIRETKERSENNGHLLRCSVFKKENKIEEESPEDIYVPSKYSLRFSTESLKCDCGKHATTGRYNMALGH